MSTLAAELDDRLDTQACLDAIEHTQAMVCFDLDGRILHANERFLSTVGYSLSEVQGRHHSMFCTPQEAASTAYREFWALLRGGEPRQGEFMRLGRHGRPIWLQATYTPVPDEAGRPRRIIKFASDITLAKMRSLEDAARISALLRTQLVVEFDLEGHILDANGLFLAAMGYRREEVLGLHHRVFCCPGQADSATYATFWQRLSTGEPQAGEFMRLDKAGHAVWLQATYTPILGPDGKAYKVVKFATDITEAVTARQAREQATAGLVLRDQALSSISDAVVILAVEPTRVHALYANPAASRLVGCTLTELLQPDGHALRATLLNETCLGAVRHAIAQGAPQRLRLRLGPCDQSVCLDVTLNPMSPGTTSTWSVHHVVLTADDVTARVLAEDAVREHNERIQAMFSLSADGFACFDRDQRASSVNPAFVRLTGLPAETWLGLSADSFNARLAECIAERNPPGTQAWLSNTRTGQAEVWLLHGPTPRYVVCTRQRSPGGALSMLLHLRDITAECEADRVKRDFVANMSHEIRTPMNGVIGLIDVLREGGLTDEQSETAELIRSCGQALLGILDEILDFSKIEAGQLRLEHIPYDSAQVIEQACGVLDQIAQDKHVDLSLHTDPDVPALVMGDPLRLRQIVMNLGGNAVKFSSRPERRGRVHVRWGLAGDAQGRTGLRLTVRDDGIGMSPDVVANLFRPFVQADLSTTRRFGGTGLGLTITRALVQGMGGQIHVDSTEGQGSCFSVWLPLEAGDAMGPRRDAARWAPLEGLPCVLVAPRTEAEQAVAADFCAYLSRVGAQVAQVATLEEADALLRATPHAARQLCIIDDPDNLCAIDNWPPAETLPAGVHLILLGRGKRKRVRERISGIGHSLDANGLSRNAWLEAVLQVVQAKVPPRVPTEASPATAAATSSPTGSAPATARAMRPERILVAEDNPANQKVIAFQLASLGFRAQLASDGEAALAMLSEGEWDLLLTDLHMPRLDGYRLTQALRERGMKARNGQPLPIIALTANAMGGEADHCREQGMDDYLTKPTALALLSAMVDKWLLVDAAAAPPQ